MKTKHILIAVTALFFVTSCCSVAERSANTIIKIADKPTAARWLLFPVTVGASIIVAPAMLGCLSSH